MMKKRFGLNTAIGNGKEIDNPVPTQVIQPKPVSKPKTQAIQALPMILMTVAFRPS